MNIIARDAYITANKKPEDICRICKTDDNKKHGEIVFNTTMNRYHLDCIMNRLEEVMNKLENK